MRNFQFNSSSDRVEVCGSRIVKNKKLFFNCVDHIIRYIQFFILGVYDIKSHVIYLLFRDKHRQGNPNLRDKHCCLVGNVTHVQLIRE